MNPSPTAPPPIPVEAIKIEVLPPGTAGARPTSTASASAGAPPRYWYHPLSGALILGVDWLMFGPEAITGELAALVTCPLAFLIVSVGVFGIQRWRNGDSVRASLAKALFGGLLAGLPTPISGTILGGLVLALSGSRKTA